MKNVYILKDLYGRPMYRLLMDSQGKTAKAVIAFTNRKEAEKYARKEFGYVTDVQGKCVGGCLIEKFTK